MTLQAPPLARPSPPCPWPFLRRSSLLHLQVLFDVHLEWGWPDGSGQTQGWLGQVGFVSRRTSSVLRRSLRAHCALFRPRRPVAARLSCPSSQSCPCLGAAACASPWPSLQVYLPGMCPWSVRRTHAVSPDFRARRARARRLPTRLYSLPMTRRLQSFVVSIAFAPAFSSSAVMSL